MGSVRQTVRFATFGLALGAGCFFTDPVNTAPHAEIRQVDAGPVFVNSRVHLSADKSHDPDGDRPYYYWLAFNCPEGATACTELQSGASPDFYFDIPGHDRVAVQLTVSDEHGARTTTALDLVPTNRVPDVNVTVSGPENTSGGFTVARELIVTADATDADLDELDLILEVFPPPGAGAFVWEPIDATHQRLVPDVTGTWEVSLRADDGFDLSPAAIRTFRVDEDQPPCIGATTPATTAGRIIVERSEPPRRFAVESVLDDLDPWPIAPGSSLELGGARFRWLVGAPGQLAVVDGLALPDLTFDASAHAPGEVLGLRVEVTDRVARTLPCDEATAICPTDGCARRVTWEVEVR